MNQVSLWRQCRAVACPVRVRILDLLNQKPGQYVKEIAGQLGLAEDVASKNLQVLASSGLLTSERQGKFNFYRLNAEDPLLAVVVNELRRPDFDRMIRMLTALTHERRVGMVALLKEGSLTTIELCRRLKISRRAMERHLDKLIRRGWLFVENDLCILEQSTDRFGKALQQCVEASGTPAQVCQKGKG